jgi:hypothetical protein
MFNHYAEDVNKFLEVLKDLTIVYTREYEDDNREQGPIDRIIKLNERVKKLKKVREASLLIEINDELKELLYEIALETISMLIIVKDIQEEEVELKELKNIFSIQDDEDEEDIFENIENE